MEALIVQAHAALAHHHNQAELVIDQSHCYQAREATLFERIFPCFRRATSNTIGHIKQVVGEENLRSVFERKEYGLNLKALEDETLVVTKRIAATIFAALADTGDPSFPWDHLEASFLGSQIRVNFLDQAATSGKGLQGLQERVWLAHHHRSNMHREHPEMRDLEMLTSRFADREPPVGAVIDRFNGTFVVDRIFSRGGAHIIALRDLAGKENPCLICRGTAMRRTATGGWLSGINDILPQIGSHGIGSVFPAIQAYLKDKEAIDICGKSLGGGMAQRLTALIFAQTNTRVDRLSTLCSVGVSDEVHKLFAKTFSGKQMDLCIVRNVGDYIPLMGGKHIGHKAIDGLSVKLYHLSQSPNSPAAFPETSWFGKLRGFARSFKDAHLRQYTLQSFHLHEIEDHEAELKRDDLEWIRLIIARIFNVLTFGRFNQHPLSGGSAEGVDRLVDRGENVEEAVHTDNLKHRTYGR